MFLFLFNPIIGEGHYLSNFVAFINVKLVHNLASKCLRHVHQRFFLFPDRKSVV